MDASIAGPEKIVEEKKIWGRTYCLYKDANSQVNLIDVVPFGYCSRHYHEAKYNCFIVFAGRLTIRHYDVEGHVLKDVVIGAGERFTVSHRVWHRFLAPDGPVSALEIYWAPGLNVDDIVRFDEGGIGGLKE